MTHRLAALLLLLSASASAADRENVMIVLKENALVDRVGVRLSDVADIRTRDSALRNRLGKLSIGWVPRTGASRSFRRAEVRELIARVDNAPTVAVGGATATTVQLRTREYPAARLFEVARNHLSKHLHERFPALTDINVAPAVGEAVDLSVPVGDLTIVPRPIRGSGMSKRVCVWMDLRLDGKAYRSMPVWLSVAAYAPAVVAKRSIRPREKLGPGDVTVEERDITGTDPALIARPSDIAGRRARVFIAAGNIVQTKNLEPNPPVLADDLVNVRVVAGPILIETQAVAEQDGYVGDYVKLRNPKTAAIFSARVVGENTVAITPR
ncbi:MAG TPA: flagellar basal body P-ring formation chaperone FlgA [Burkholderiales bacterium]